jgi:hypothetical protein
MSVLRPLLSRRGRLALAAAALLLMVALVAVPSVSGARAAVKKFTASISPSTAVGQAQGSWTETITNCGAPLPAPCTVSSTINLGTIQIQVPVEFRPITSVSASSPSGQPTRNWTVSYDSATGRINGFANGGTDKLLPGESILITFEATPSTCSGPTEPFTTSAWGSTPSPGQDLFAIVGNQPTVNITGCGVASGGSITDPVTGQTETISGDFQGHVNISFDGDLIDCSFDPQFGNQWSHFHLRAQVNITPAADFMAGSGPKISTSTFTPVVEGDSSFYLICWAAPTTFATRGGGTATEQNGLFVGILPNCYNPTTGGTRPEPCVSEQFKDITTNKIVISVRTPPGDPHKR